MENVFYPVFLFFFFLPGRRKKDVWKHKKVLNKKNCQINKYNAMLLYMVIRQPTVIKKTKRKREKKGKRTKHKNNIKYTIRDFDDTSGSGFRVV